jgi:hypothetical protein
VNKHHVHLQFGRKHLLYASVLVDIGRWRKGLLTISAYSLRELTNNSYLIRSIPESSRSALFAEVAPLLIQRPRIRDVARQIHQQRLRRFATPARLEALLLKMSTAPAPFETIPAARCADAARTALISKTTDGLPEHSGSPLFTSRPTSAPNTYATRVESKVS